MKLKLFLLFSILFLVGCGNSVNLNPNVSLNKHTTLDEVMEELNYHKGLYKQDNVYTYSLSINIPINNGERHIDFEKYSTFQKNIKIIRKNHLKILKNFCEIKNGKFITDTNYRNFGISKSMWNKLKDYILTNADTTRSLPLKKKMKAICITNNRGIFALFFTPQLTMTKKFKTIGKTSFFNGYYIETDYYHNFVIPLNEDFIDELSMLNIEEKKEKQKKFTPIIPKDSFRRF